MEIICFVYASDDFHFHINHFHISSDEPKHAFPECRDTETMSVVSSMYTMVYNSGIVDDGEQHVLMLPVCSDKYHIYINSCEGKIYFWSVFSSVSISRIAPFQDFWENFLNFLAPFLNRQRVGTHISKTHRLNMRSTHVSAVYLSTTYTFSFSEV